MVRLRPTLTPARAGTGSNACEPSEEQRPLQPVSPPGEGGRGTVWAGDASLGHVLSQKTALGKLNPAAALTLQQGVRPPHRLHQPSGALEQAACGTAQQSESQQISG